MERKIVHFELKGIDEETGIFEGYAATFAKIPDSYGDIIDPGAFKKSLKEGGKRIKVLWNHNAMEPIGRPEEMSEDDKGLLVKGKLSLGVQRAREVLSLMKDRVITEMSIGYDTVKQEMTDGIRHLKEVKLWDVSPVTFAANPEAQIMAVKEAVEFKPYPNEHACRLRNPADFQNGTFRRMTRRSDGKVYSVIMGKLDGEDTMTEQAYRYDKDVWSAEDAQTHCKDHDGSFEAASKRNEDIIAEAKASLEALQALLEKAEGKQEPVLTTPAPEESKEAADMESVLNRIGAEIDGFDTKAAEARIDQLLSKYTEVK